MVRRTEEHHERRERSQPKLPSPSGREKRKPRGALFYGDDPTLAKRVEEELRSLGR